MSWKIGHNRDIFFRRNLPQRRGDAEIRNLVSTAPSRSIFLPSYLLPVLQSSRLTLLILLLLAPFFAVSQTADDILSKFFAVQQDDEVLLRWTIRAGNTCEDTFIERSLDGMQYERIGTIAGVCGSPDQPVTYDFYDTLPAPNRINHYRLILGLYGYTEPQSVEYIVLNEQGYSLQPNPMGETATLIFRNPAEEAFHFLLYDMNGRKVMDLITYGDRIILRREELATGVFIFQLEGKNQKITGKLIVP